MCEGVDFQKRMRKNNNTSSQEIVKALYVII